MAVENMSQTANFFSQVRLFSNLSEEERQALASRAFRKSFDSGQTFFLEGEPCHGLYLIAHPKPRDLGSRPSRTRNRSRNGNAITGSPVSKLRALKRPSR